MASVFRRARLNSYKSSIRMLIAPSTAEAVSTISSLRLLASRGGLYERQGR